MKKGKHSIQFAIKKDFKFLVKNCFLSCFVLLLFLSNLPGQDQHFTQFYASPLTLNPALTGTFDGKYRFGLIYRDQWRSVADNPSVSFGAAIDLRYPVKLMGSKSKDAAAVGLLFFHDKTPGVDFFTNSINISGAYHKSLNPANDQFLSVGLQGSLAQRNINYENLTFGDQFNGADGYTNATGETPNLPANNFGFSDLHIGLNYTYAPRGGVGIFIGGAIHHILEPQVSFFYDPATPEAYPLSKLFRKYSGQFNIDIPASRKLRISPRALIASQGPHLEINAGSNFRFLLDDSKGTAFHIGGWARPVGNENSEFGLDAVILMLGLEYNKFLFGVSYDSNIESLANNGLNRNAIEFSIIFLGEYEDETVLCPKF